MSAEAEWMDILLSVVCYGMYAWCLSIFLKRQLQGKAAQAWSFGGALWGIHVAALFFLERENIPYILYALANHGALACLIMASFRGEKEKKLLAAAVLAVMSGLIWNFTDSFLCCGWLVLTHLLTGGSQAVSVGVWGGRCITVMTCAAGITAVSLLSKPLEPVFADKRRSWYLFLTIPLFSIVLVTDLVNWAASNGIVVQAWEKYGLYENQLFSHGAMCLFTGLAMAMSGFLVFGMDRLDREERVREQYQSQVMYYQMMEEEYSRMERLRHDMKNHVIALKHLVQNRQWEKAAGYLEEMAGAGGVEAGDEITGSLVIDALLYHKRRQAKERGIRWQCDARLPRDCPVKEIDLCIIVGNVLDNALEACRKAGGGEPPFIQVYLGTIKRCLLLEAKNTMPPEEGEGDWEDKRERDRTEGAGTGSAETGNTTARRAGTGSAAAGSAETGSAAAERAGTETAGGRGLGLGNIKSAAAHYNGVVGVEIEQGVFTISVLLPLYSQEEERNPHMT